MDIISGIIDNLEANGIHALVDVHQDVISSYFCEYDGAPKYVIDLSNSSVSNAFPWPLPVDANGDECDRKNWGVSYLGEAVGVAFQGLYDNLNGMRDYYVDFYQYVAAALKSKDLLGYEFINEPWAGDIYKHPELLLPGVAGSKNLQRFYDAVVDKIRLVDDSHLMFYEPVTWGMILNGTVSGSGFTHVCV